MKSFIIGILGIVGTSVESFSTVPSPLKTTATTTALSVSAQTDVVNEATTFWAKPRNEQEIVDFVSDAVFNNGNEAANNNAPPQVQDHQWVEVISAEPPVRRSDFTHPIIFNLRAKCFWCHLFPSF